MKSDPRGVLLEGVVIGRIGAAASECRQLKDMSAGVRKAAPRPAVYTFVSLFDQLFLGGSHLGFQIPLHCPTVFPTMKACFVALALVFATASCAFAADNTLTAAEKSAGWQLLFNGKSLAGWRPYAGKALSGWEVKDGTLHAIAKVKGSELITEKKYKDFEFSWEWRVPVAGNNGVKYFVTESRPKSPGHEYQMLDDNAHPDGKKGANRQTAAFYDVLPPAADKPYREPGEWNQSKVVVRGNTVEHWLNGKNVLTYELGSAAVKAGLAKSKFATDPGFGDKIEGHIMLTYHSDDCWYRNVKIRELK